MTYIIYRAYSIDERPDDTIDERNILFAWTNDKHLLKMFMQQRNPEKYRINRCHREDLERYYSDIDTKDMKLDLLPLRSKSTDGFIYIISTKKELDEFQGKVRELMDNLSSLEVIKGGGNYLDMIYNLEEKYSDALNFLGYTPREFQAFFTSGFDSYSESNDPVIFNYIYSAEAFIKVMLDDMI